MLHRMRSRFSDMVTMTQEPTTVTCGIQKWSEHLQRQAKDGETSWDVLSHTQDCPLEREVPFLPQWLELGSSRCFEMRWDKCRYIMYIWYSMIQYHITVSVWLFIHSVCLQPLNFPSTVCRCWMGTWKKCKGLHPSGAKQIAGLDFSNDQRTTRVNHGQGEMKGTNDDICALIVLDTSCTCPW